MMPRTQISLDPELLRRARQRAVRFGASLAECVRRLVARDVAEPRSEADPSSIFDLGASGGSDMRHRKDAMIGKAVAARRSRRRRVR